MRVPSGNVKPGDLALHRSNQLDAREVSRVGRGVIWLLIGDEEFGPFPKANYTFTRVVVE